MRPHLDRWIPVIHGQKLFSSVTGLDQSWIIMQPLPSANVEFNAHVQPLSAFDGRHPSST